MKRLAYSCAFALLAFAMVAVGLAPRAAAQDSGIAGTILDLDGKPWENLPVTIVSDQGSKLDTKTDAKGKYDFHNLRSGTYLLTVQLPNQAQPFQGGQVKVGAGQTIEVRGEVFNLFNTPNFAAPAAVLGAANFGTITSALDPRVVQLALKWIF